MATHLPYFSFASRPFAGYTEFQDAMKRKKASGSSTSNQVSQITIHASIEKWQLYDRKGKKWNEHTDAIIHYIVK